MSGNNITDDNDKQSSNRVDNSIQVIPEYMHYNINLLGN
jgi:hypothetical protein